jgi:hypothetical protein
MAKFPIPKHCSAYVPMILKEFCSSKINGLVMLIAWILWELFPFELRNFPKFTTEAACQRNSSETTEKLQKINVCFCPQKRMSPPYHKL